MSVATVTPHPRLAVVASEARKEARAQKREKSPLRKVMRTLTVTLAILFATLGLGAGTAQAWPWSNMQEDITAFVTNFCGPMDVPVPSGHEGLDNLFGLNTGDSDIRGTVRPDTSGLASSPLNGLDRIQQAYGAQSDTIKPTYERYGFSTLQWDSYGAGCFSQGYWFTGVANLFLNYFVLFPMMVAMAALQLALGNILYTVFAGVISPFVSIFTAIFKGWALLLAPIGIIWAFVRSGGNLRVVAKTGVWMLMILGVFLWMGNNTSPIVTKANNFVTEFANTAANQMNEINGVRTGTDGTAVTEINQSLWYGVPYQTWLEGTVGPRTAAGDRTRENNGEVSWGSVLLNGKYVGNDDAGREVISNVEKWNGLSYSPNESLVDEAFDDMKTKPGAWTKNKMWERIPYLFNVKAMCADTSNGGGFLNGSSSAEEDNKWMYGGSCDSASAGTSSMIPYFTGTDYNARLATAFSGGFAAFAVSLAISLAGLYLMVQKMLFYFLLLFGPVFLTVAMFGDEKRAAFAKRYGELMIANILKQGVAVLVVLFVANSMSMLLYPPADEQFSALREIPWMLKPTLALLFLIGLALFLLPLKRIVTGAVKGDTKVVDKTARMPVDAAKTTAKAGAAVGVGAAAIAAVVATGGAAAPAVAKMGGMAMSAGRMAGARGGVGKSLQTLGRGANLAARVGGSMADGQSKKAALGNLAKGVFDSDPKSKEMLSKIPGALDKDGKMTPKGQAIMSNAIKKTSKQGEQSARADALQKSYMDKFYKGHLAQTGKHHAMDPNSPENLRAAAVAKEKDRMAVKEAAKHDSSRSANTAGQEGKPGTGPNGTNGPNRTNGVNAESGSNAPNGGDGAKRERSREQSAEAVRENVSGPGFAQDQNIKANVTVEGAQIAEQLGKTSREVAQDPASLLTSTAYGGGDVAKMDPRHPATGAMNDLRFAMMAGDEQGIQSASMKASEAISQHGLPSEVSVSAVSGTPEGMATVVNAMPTVSDDTPWQVRSEGATTMQAAMAMVPESSPAYEPMQNYVRALSDPNVDSQTVEGMRSLVIESAAPEVAADAPTVDMSAAIRESAEQVSAAPAAVVAEQGPLFGEAPAEAPAQAPVYTSVAPSFTQAEAPASHEPGPAPASYEPGPAPASYETGPAPASSESAPAPASHEPGPAPAHEAPARETPSYEEGPVNEAPAQVAPVYRSPEPSVVDQNEAPARVEHTDAGYRVSDYEGRVYDGLSSEAASAMPVPPIPSASDGHVSAEMDLDRVRRELSEISEEAADKYRQKMTEWRDNFNVPEPTLSTPSLSGGGHEDSGRPSMFGGGGIDLGKSPADDVEEISGMPTEDNDDNSQSFRRSRRRRISGFFDMEDEDENETKGGE